jgi:hypothetical protein
VRLVAFTTGLTLSYGGVFEFFRLYPLLEIFVAIETEVKGRSFKQICTIGIVGPVAAGTILFRQMNFPALGGGRVQFLMTLEAESSSGSDQKLWLFASVSRVTIQAFSFCDWIMNILVCCHWVVTVIA